MMPTATTILLGILTASTEPGDPFSWKELLGRPTDRSATVNVVPAMRGEILFQYWVEGSSDTSLTPTMLRDSGEVAEAVLDGLPPDSRCFYRAKFRAIGIDSGFRSGLVREFHTLRMPGSAFVFDIQADPHQDAATDSASYAATQANIRRDKPDFLIDLGDNFLSEKYSHAQSVLTQRLHLARSWYDNICHSIPLYLVVGNHEGELGWYNDGTDTCFAVRAANERRKYYPNPIPDGFYSGDTLNTPGVGRRESWYSWIWGDALFVVIDPYWEARKGKDPDVERGWDFSLGKEQYEWLKSTLRGSGAPYKFVFAHQLVGGDEPFVAGASQGTGRGGAAWAHLYEMGGYSESGSWDWERLRPGWEKPIHQLLVETGVDVYFHGHDHLFAMESKDGVVYQECPQPGLANYSKAGNAEVYGYTNPTGVLPNSGHLRVRVDRDSSTVEYVRSFTESPRNASNGWTDGMTAFSYSIRPQPSNGTIRQPPTPHDGIAVGWDGRTPVFRYRLEHRSRVRLEIVDLRGATVGTLVDAQEDAGWHSLRWNGPRPRGTGPLVAVLESDGTGFATLFHAR